MDNFDFLLTSPDFASFGEAAASTARKFRVVQQNRINRNYSKISNSSNRKEALSKV